MIYELTDDQKRIADKYRTFAEEELAPRAVLLDGSPLESVNDLMRENLKYLASAGFLGLGHEKACSGSDAGWVTLAVARVFGLWIRGRRWIKRFQHNSPGHRAVFFQGRLVSQSI